VITTFKIVVTNRSLGLRVGDRRSSTWGGAKARQDCIVMDVSSLSSLKNAVRVTHSKLLFCCSCWNDLLVLYTGNLHFAHLRSSDMQNNKVYKCNVHNPYLDLMIGGSYTRLHITPCTYYITLLIQMYAECMVQKLFYQGFWFNVCRVLKK